MVTGPGMTGNHPLGFDRDERPRPHTHLSVGDIIREQRIGLIERIFLWLAKTDYYVLHVAPNNCRVYLVSLGMMVLFTTMLAFCSSLYTLKSTLLPPDAPRHLLTDEDTSAAPDSPASGDVSLTGIPPRPADGNEQPPASGTNAGVPTGGEPLTSGTKWAIALLLASIYAFGILIVDREIVGAVSKKTLIVRFLFAIVIATAVSWPVKLKFFEGRVNSEIRAIVSDQVADEKAYIDKLTSDNERLNKEIAGLGAAMDAARAEQRRSLEERQNELKQLANFHRDMMLKEKNIVDCLKKCKEWEAKLNADLDEIAQIEEKKQALGLPRQVTELERLERNRKIAAIEQNLKDIEKKNQEIALVHATAYDFLYKWQALERIGKSKDFGPDYKVMSIFIFLFFMLLEMVPLALKWSLGNTEYHYYLEARTNLNNQKIISLANLYMARMQRDDSVVLDTPAEITDMMAWLIEDESREHVAPMETRSLKEVLMEKQAQRTRPEGAASSESGSGAQRQRGAGAASAGEERPSGGQAYDQTVDEDEPQR